MTTNHTPTPPDAARLAALATGIVQALSGKPVLQSPPIPLAVQVDPERGTHFLVDAKGRQIFNTRRASLFGFFHFIVRACNAHERLERERDELVAALRLVKEAWHDGSRDVEVMNAVRSALAKVQST